jgi:uncharacterized membrane protein
MIARRIRVASDATWRPADRTTVRRLIALLILAAYAAFVFAPAAAAAGGVELSTPYTAVAVEPGQTTSFELTLTSNAERRIGLEVGNVPDGWTATVRGGGFIVDGVTAGPDLEPELTLDVEVPEGTADGDYALSVEANGGGAAVDTLELDLRVAAAAAGTVGLETDNPLLRDDATATFPFSLTLSNDTPRELTFALSTTSPGAGWIVNATPSGQAQAASVVVAAGSSSTISVSVDPPDAAPAGTYDIGITASAGDQSAQATVQVEIVGQADLQFTTADNRLSTNASAGSRKDLSVLLVNNGTAPIADISLSGTGPNDWDIAFEPQTVAAVQPGEAAAQTVTAQITPSGSAIAGDYQVTLTATTADGVSETLQLRVTVDTSLSWGLVGIALIALTLVGLFWVFQRYGRR